MKLITYISPEAPEAEILWRAIERAVSPEQVQVHESATELVERLKTGLYGLHVVLVLAPSKEDMAKLVDAQDALDRFRVVLFIPDQDPETLSQGHSLYPRFLGWASDDLPSLDSILQKMLSSQETKCT
jgi:hypothetical protein